MDHGGHALSHRTTRSLVSALRIPRSGLWAYVVVLSIAFAALYAALVPALGAPGNPTLERVVRPLYGLIAGAVLAVSITYRVVLNPGRYRRIRIAHSIDRFYFIWVLGVGVWALLSLENAGNPRYLIGDTFLALFPWLNYAFTRQVLRGKSLAYLFDVLRKTAVWAIAIRIATGIYLDIAQSFVAHFLAASAVHQRRQLASTHGLLSVLAIALLAMGRGRAQLMQAVLALAFWIVVARPATKVRVVALGLTAVAVAFMVFGEAIQGTAAYTKTKTMIVQLKPEDITSQSLGENAGERVFEVMDVSTGQRVFEAVRVLEAWRAGGLRRQLFGNGFGAFLDVSGTADVSVLDGVVGARDTGLIHSIHLMPFAVLHRQGLVGLLMYGYLVITVWLWRMPRHDSRVTDLTLACKFTVYAAFLEGFFAYGQLNSSPFVGISMGVMAHLHSLTEGGLDT